MWMTLIQKILLILKTAFLHWKDTPGTPFTRAGNVTDWEPFPIEDESNVDVRRRKIGLIRTLEAEFEYIKTL